MIKSTTNAMVMAMFALFVRTASAQCQEWQHAGSLILLTFPERADLAATASEENFPVLVRLDKDWFDFEQAQPNGGDVRFASSTGELIYGKNAIAALTFCEVPIMER